MGKVLIVVCCVLWVVGCTSRPTEQQVSDHRKDVDAWFEKRVAALKGHDGWLNLAGLFWLKEGFNSYGSDPANDLVFPSGTIVPKAGYFFVKGQQVTMTPTATSDVGQATIIFYPDSNKSITVSRNSLEWFVIRRDDKLGIRLRDLDSDKVKNFMGIERYPVDYSWKIPARFEPGRDGETIDITNVLGQTTATPVAGTYVFEVE